jgi:hypothetical protein
MIGLMNENDVPWMQSSRAPTGPMRRHCTKVARPETKSDIETRNPVVVKSNFRAELMIRGGVMIATKIANRC